MALAGVHPFHTPVRTVSDPGRPVWKWCYFRDPEGNRIQVIHHPPISGAL